MRRASGVLAFVAGAVLVATTAGVAIGQEESPSPDASMSPEASPEAVEVEPSSLDIIDVAADKTANKPLKGKKLRNAVAKAAPAAASYVINSTGEDAIGRIIGLSQAARAADEAGDAKAAAAYLALARLLYRNAWSAAKTDPDSLNADLESAIAAAGLQGDPALMPAAIWDRWIDICVDPGGSWFIAPEGLWGCEEEGGTMVRADFTGIEPDENTSPDDVEQVDAGGLGIHKVVQDASANDKLAGKQFKKAWAKTLKKHGPAIVNLTAGGPDVSGEQQVIELVLAAREADEAGNAKAAKAFMSLALATYRSLVPKPTEGTINTEALNYSIAGLIESDYADVPGLTLMTPPDLMSVCYRPKDSVCLQNAGDHTPWECAQGGAVLTRMTYEEALAADCDEVE